MTLTPLSRPVTPLTRRYPWPTLLFSRRISPDSTGFLTAVTMGLADPSFRPCALRALDEARVRRLTGLHTKQQGLQAEKEGVWFRMVLAFGLAPGRTIEGPERLRLRV
jgi:hypothetical protein